MNNDPNFTDNRRVAIMQVKLVFGEWRFRREMVVEVRGSLRGLDVINQAIKQAATQIEVKQTEDDLGEIHMFTT